MKLFFKYRYLLPCSISLALVLLLYDCKKPCGLTDELKVATTVNFKDSASKQIKQIKIDSFFSKIYGIGGNGMLSADSGGKSISLPFSARNDSSAFVFESKNRKDTLVISYTRKSHFESERCGYVMEYNDIKVSYYTFDSAAYSPAYTTRYFHKNESFPESIYIRIKK